MNTGVIIVAIIFSSSTVISLAGLLYSYRLKKEKINADTLVRAEEVKARNQLEIEKLLISKEQQPNIRAGINADETYSSSRTNRQKA